MGDVSSAASSGFRAPAVFMAATYCGVVVVPQAAYGVSYPSRSADGVAGT